MLGRRYVAAAGGITLASAVVFYGLAGAGRLHGDGLYYLVMVLGIDPVRRRIGWPDPLLIAAAASWRSTSWPRRGDSDASCRSRWSGWSSCCSA